MLVAAWLTFAALAGTLEVSDRTEFRLRYPGLVSGAGSLDLETDPDVQLTLASRRTVLLLEYNPQLVSWDMNFVGLEPVYLNRGTARAGWHDEHLRLSLNETASYGVQNYASLVLPAGTAGSPPPVALFPPATTFLYEGSVTTLEAKWTSRRWTLEGAAAYQLAGGATSTAREILPLQSGPLATLEGDYSMTRLDHLITAAAASYAALEFAPSSTFSPAGVQVGLVEVDEAWRHGWSRTLSSLLRGGASEAATQGVSDTGIPESPPAHFETDPVAEASLRYDLSSRSSTGDVTLACKLAPTINPFIGLVDERIGGVLAGHYQQGVVGLRFQAAFSESVPPSRLTGVRLYYSEVAATYRLSRAVSIEIGSRTLWQEPSASAAALALAPANAVLPVPVVQEVGFIALTLKADPIRF